LPLPERPLSRRAVCDAGGHSPEDARFSSVTRVCTPDGRQGVVQQNRSAVLSISVRQLSRGCVFWNRTDRCLTEVLVPSMARFHLSVLPLICPVLSRALLRLTANIGLAAPCSTAGFCFRSRGPFGFRLPRLPADRRSAPLHASLCDLYHRLAGAGSIAWPERTISPFESSSTEGPCTGMNHRLAASAKSGSIPWPEVQNTPNNKSLEK
jgi:hypothetical protein